MKSLRTLTMLACCAVVPVFAPSLAGEADAPAPKGVRILFTTDTSATWSPAGDTAVGWAVWPGERHC